MSSQRQLILDYLADTLLPGITTGNGYNFTVNLVERGLKPITSVPNSKFPALFVTGADEARENVTHKDFMSIMSVFIVGYVKKSSANLEVQKQLDMLIEDLTKRLYTDPTQSAKASWTEIKRIAVDDGDDFENAQFSMQVDFRYKNAGTSP